MWQFFFVSCRFRFRWLAVWISYWSLFLKCRNKFKSATKTFPTKTELSRFKSLIQTELLDKCANRKLSMVSYCKINKLCMKSLKRWYIMLQQPQCNISHTSATTATFSLINRHYKFQRQKPSATPADYKKLSWLCKCRKYTLRAWGYMRGTRYNRAYKTICLGTILLYVQWATSQEIWCETSLEQSRLHLRRAPKTKEAIGKRREY